jgi:hypothetical protein
MFTFITLVGLAFALHVIIIQMDKIEGLENKIRECQEEKNFEKRKKRQLND